MQSKVHVDARKASANSDISVKVTSKEFAKESAVFLMMIFTAKTSKWLKS